MKKLMICVVSFMAILNASEAKNYISTQKGIIVNLNPKSKAAAKCVRLEVVNDNIVHVSATPGNQFSTEKSLIIHEDAPAKQTSFQTSETGNLITLSTRTLKAQVNSLSGEVKFLDKSGKVILQENKGGGKSFKSINVEGTKGYSIRQVFESPADEAFYGLGQHQADEINYKGKNEILYQYNTKVSIPFVVSNKNYGILWDNYSVTKFGDVRDYAQINQFKLYDQDGKEGALTATYLVNSDPSKVFAKRREATIDYENLETVKNFPAKFPFNNAKIVWEGQIEPSESGLFRFITYYAGYTKVWINGELMMDKWRTAWNPNSAKFNVKLEKGKRYPVKLEWCPDGGVSYISLKALSPVVESEQQKLSLASEMGNQIDYYFIKGKNADEVIGGMRRLTGKAQVMPKWAMGFWQSFERYKTQDELVNTVAEFRKRHIPLDNIVQDWSYWSVDQWGSHDFDPARFSDPKKMLDDIHAMNAKVMISVWPKFYHNTEHYKEFDTKGWMFRRAVQDSVRDWIGEGYIGSFYDAYAPGARKLFWNQMNDHLFSKGTDAWWMDASEPDILSNASMQYRKQLMTPTALGPSTKYFNTYALMNAKAIYEGQRSVSPNQRVFLLTRSGFAGSQGYAAATWSGDIGTCWEDMKAQISAGINFALSGNPYWTMDIGGFSVQKRFERAKEGSEDMEEWRELNTRWFQFGTFAPLFRVHGQTPRREMFNMSPESHPAYQSMLYYNKLRYKLMPYIYSLTGKVYFNDYTIMRGLAMDFGNDSKVNNIGDQFMFGPSLLINPVYQYKARERQLYLPAGAGWYDLYSGKYQAGGQSITANAPFERMPMYVKAGSIIPFGPEIEYTAQKPADVITLYVYAGANGSFDLYEDQGENYDYEKGKYAQIPFIYNDKARTLEIGQQKGQFDGMLKQRTFNIVVISPDKAAGIDTQENIAKTITYTGEKIEIAL